MTMPLRGPSASVTADKVAPMLNEAFALAQNTYPVSLSAVEYRRHLDGAFTVTAFLDKTEEESPDVRIVLSESFKREDEPGGEPEEWVTGVSVNAEAIASQFGKEVSVHNATDDSGREHYRDISGTVGDVELFAIGIDGTENAEFGILTFYDWPEDVERPSLEDIFTGPLSP